MTTIRSAAEDYLAVRRCLGFKLGTRGRVLMDVAAYLERKGMDTVTTEAAVEWAITPSGASALWHAMRLGVARRFAAHLRLLDPGCEVPPPTCCRKGTGGSRRTCSQPRTSPPS
jgi:hypothetical protein